MAIILFPIHLLFLEDEVAINHLIVTAENTISFTDSVDFIDPLTRVVIQILDFEQTLTPHVKTVNQTLGLNHSVQVKIPKYLSVTHHLSFFSRVAKATRMDVYDFLYVHDRGDRPIISELDLEQTINVDHCRATSSDLEFEDSVLVNNDYVLEIEDSLELVSRTNHYET